MNRIWSLILLAALFLPAVHGGAFAQEASKRQQAQAEVEKARELLRQGHFDSAVVSYQKAFEIDPGFVDAYAELGKLMLEKRNFAYAIQMYEKLENLEPSNTEWTKVLFTLYSSYEATEGALRSGEKLIAAGEADADLLQKMADIYRETNRPKGLLRVRELYAEKATVNAEWWAEQGDLYGQQLQFEDAARCYAKAQELDPGNQKYQVGEGLVYIDQNKLDLAEEHFKKLIEANPNDEGLKGHLARVYALQGDRYLTTNRANTAKTYYDKASETTSGDLELDPQLEVQPQVRTLTSLGRSLNERKAIANDLLDPYILTLSDFGNVAGNSYIQSQNQFVVPIRGTELDIRVRGDYYSADAFNGDGSASYGYIGARYNFDRTWSATGFVGQEGLFDFVVQTDSDNYQAGVRVFRNLWAFTPLAIDQDLKYTDYGAFFDVGLGERFSLDGTIDFQDFDDGVTQTVYGIGPTYLLINDPARRQLGLSYRYFGVSNSREIDPLLRFSPVNQTGHSLGLQHSELVSDNWRIRAGYFYSWLNNGGTGNSWLIGTDFRVNNNTFVGIEYLRGNFRDGFINPNIVQDLNNNDNDNLRLDMRIGF